jgi:isoquinoline 1-oxidoreductase subunit alpha
MAKISLNINDKTYALEAEPQMPLLWALRDIIGLTGTKYGCGVSMCGACTVQLNGQPVRSCQIQVGMVRKGKITTIEGISAQTNHVIQHAWIAEQVPQCGYCQSGQIMSALALLKTNSNPTDDDIDTALSGNLCRCGTYPRIRKAIHRAAEMLKENGGKTEVPSSENTGSSIKK